MNVCMYVHVGFLSISSPGWNWEATALLIAIPTPSIIARMIPPVSWGWGWWEGRRGEAGQEWRRGEKERDDSREGGGGREREGGRGRELLHIFQLCRVPQLLKLTNLPKIAEPRAALGPFLAMSRPPVRKPLPIEFQGSSLSLNQIREQSKDEYMQPHTPKLPGEGETEKGEGGGGGGGREREVIP